MIGSIAVICSAIAALFSALSSFLIMRIQRQNLLESVRPELALTGWTRRSEGQNDAEHEVIAFQTLRNVGRGAAFHIVINANHIIDNRPAAGLSTTRLPILAANESSALNGEIVVWWKNVPPDSQGHKHLGITVDMLCWDSRGMRHETQYNLFAAELSPNMIVVSDPIAPGVMLGTRTTATRPVWLLKLSATLKRIIWFVPPD